MTKGIKVAQQGIDVSSAADYQLVISSLWPQLSIIAQGAFNIAANSATPAPIVSHGLGYLPIFVVFQTGGTFGNSGGNANLGASWTNFPPISVDTNNLFVSSTLGADSFQGYYYIFKQDITATVNPTFNLPQQSGSGSASKLGIRVTKKNQTQPDSSSGLHPLIIHQAGSLNTTSGAVITHNLGYFPIFFLYSVSNNTASLQAYRAIATTVNISLSGVQAALPTTVNYVVFKDPILGGS